MIDTLTDALLIAGMAGTGALWVFAVLGILHIGWKATGAHLLEWLKQR